MCILDGMSAGHGWVLDLLLSSSPHPPHLSSPHPAAVLSTSIVGVIDIAVCVLWWWLMRKRKVGGIRCGVSGRDSW